MEKDNKTSQSIVIAAKSEFARKGFRGARMDSIARIAGVNQALIYYYFGSKDKLYHEVTNRIFAIQDKIDLSEFAKRYYLTPGQHLYAILYVMLTVHIGETDPEIDKVILQAFELDYGETKIIEHSEKYVLALLSRIENVIFDGINTGEFEVDDPYLLVIHMLYFIVIYGNNREKFEGTFFYERMYGPDYKNRAISFLMGSIFKILQPANEPVQIPVLPVQALDEIKKIIKDIVVDWRREWSVE